MSKHGPITAAPRKLIATDEISTAKFMVLWTSGVKIDDLPVRLNASQNAVRNKIKDLDLPRRDFKVMRVSSVDDTPELRAMWDAGKSHNEIGLAFGVSAPTVAKLAAKYGYQQRAMVRGNGEHITDKEKLEIQSLRLAGCSLGKIADETGRATSSIRYVLRGLGMSSARQVVIARPEKREAVPKPKDLSLGGRLRDTKGSYAMLSEIAKAQGWTQTQAQQRYHRAMAGEAVQ
jgi:uncharacterized protein YerC